GRLEAMIWVTPRAIAGSARPPPVKSGNAIGIGCTLPWVMSSLTAAAAGRGDRRERAPAAMPAPSAMRRRRLSDGDIGERVIIVGTRAVGEITRESSGADRR